MLHQDGESEKERLTDSGYGYYNRMRDHPLEVETVPSEDETLRPLGHPVSTPPKLSAL